MSLNLFFFFIYRSRCRIYSVNSILSFFVLTAYNRNRIIIQKLKVQIQTEKKKLLRLFSVTIVCKHLAYEL